jgi:hypothetical protein
MDITINDGVAEFEISFVYYDFPSILEAAKEFTETCWISIQGGKDELSLNMRIEPKDDTVTVRDSVYSFFNYILGIMHGKIKSVQ